MHTKITNMTILISWIPAVGWKVTKMCNFQHAWLQKLSCWWSKSDIFCTKCEMYKVWIVHSVKFVKLNSSSVTKTCKHMKMTNFTKCELCKVCKMTNLTHFVKLMFTSRAKNINIILLVTCYIKLHVYYSTGITICIYNNIYIYRYIIK